MSYLCRRKQWVNCGISFVEQLWYYTIRRRYVCFFLISPVDSELSPEECVRPLCSYNRQFILQTLHLQQWELILFVGTVFVSVTVQCVYLWCGT